ncbi:MAG: amidase domain-containing protein [Eubacteriales bacterium]|nr:amidase domain-containing protein [Christensenellaceae bacterium]MEA5065933.1 amidase domain-containing protein [Eubacteriales bacterium]
MDAERHAMKYCKNPNSRYKYFSNGDCTNFVSQCLKAGNMPND